MHKRYFIIVCFLFISVLVSNNMLIAQRNLKYKNVYKTVTEKSKEEAYSMLLIFQKQDPYFPNTYLQLGLIAKYWSKDYDALTDIKDVRFFIYNTGLYYGLAKSKIDDKEIRKNDDYYRNVGEFKGIDKLKFEDVELFISDQITANKIYKENVEIVTNFYNSSIDYYNNCIKIFKEINRDNRKIKDIYMAADKEFLDKLDRLENSFDSTIFSLQNYRTAIKNYPIKDHKQKYKLYPIKTYRLHGLTSSDFLQDEIKLWDYGTWVKEVKGALSNDINKLRKDIERTNDDLDKRVNEVSASNNYALEIEKYKIDEKILNRISKYDYNSLMIPFFRYKDAKQDFIIKIKDPVNDLTDTMSAFTILQKGRYYNNLVKSKQYADSLNRNFNKRINSYDVNKYKHFFEKNYKGEDGLKKYSENEFVMLQSELDGAFDNFKEFITRSLLYESSVVTLPYKKSNIDFRIIKQSFSDAKQGEYYITAFNKDNLGNYYATGYIKQKSAGVSAFVLRTHRIRAIDWLKIYPIEKLSDNYGSFIQAKDNGCELLITSVKGTVIKNHILSMGKSGKLVSKKEIKAAGLVPRYFNYDEINERYIIAFKGQSVNPFESLSDNLIINEYSGSTLTEKWSTVLNLKGSLVNIVKMNQSFFVFTNFTKFAQGSKIISGQAGVQKNETNSLLFVLDKEGVIEKTVPYLSKTPFFIADALKINSNTINLVGFRQELMSFQSSKKEDFGKLLYLLVNPKGEIYYDNREN